jgi:quercetin dioxygenase-like cupin family protein
MKQDPVETNPNHYRVLFENARVRVLEYDDAPGDRTTPHDHPDSVMVTLSSFNRRLSTGDRQIELELPAGAARWLPAQNHSGENIGATPTHTIFVELLEPTATEADGDYLGPQRS